MTYPKVSAGAHDQGVPASPRFPQIEERVLEYWETDGTFRASVENRPAGDNGANEFVFYDGQRGSPSPEFHLSTRIHCHNR